MKNSVAVFLAVMSLLLSVTGCGGGSSSDGGGGALVFPPGTVYTGSTSQADITSDNAGDLSRDSFENAMIATGFSLDSQAGPNDAAAVEGLLHLLGPGMADGGTERVPGVQEVSKTIDGQCGGTASYTVQATILTKTFVGSLEFKDFCNSNIIQNGKAEFDGTYDPDAQTFGRVNLTFVDMKTSFNGVDRTMNGTWTYEKNDATRTVTMNYDVFNSFAQNVRKVEDFVVIWTQFETYREFEVSGKFYHPLYGFVTVSTPTKFRIDQGDAHPSQGALIVTGANNRAARLTCLDAATFVVDADLDGDGQFDDWTSGPQAWLDVHYSGATVQAVITSGSAPEIVLGPLDVAWSASGFSLPSSLETTTDRVEALLEPLGPDLLDLVQGRLPSPQEITKTIEGQCGGTATYVITVYPLARTFDGTLEFQNFCNGNITQNGLVDLNGTYDAEGMTFGLVNLVFTNMSAKFFLVTRVMNGTWTYEKTGNSRTVTMNHEVYNSLAQNVHKVEDFVLTVVTGDTYRELLISGKYYHPLYGWATVATTAALTLNDGDDHVSSGVLVATGAGGRSARFTALSVQTYRIEADTDGDGVYDWDSGVLNW
ncbi:MAG: hypothetical protein V1816_10555 [Pseudomonadota bacterium]